MKKQGFILIVFLLLSTYLLAQKAITLDSCISYAFENNPYIKSSQNNLSIGEKDIAYTKGMLLPTIGISANSRLTDLYENQNEYLSSGAGINITQPVWKNGKLRILIEMAKSDKAMAEERFTIDKFDLAYEITQQYLTILKFGQLESLSDEMVKRIAVNVESAKERNKIGIARQSDILRAETRLSDAIIAANRYKTQKEVAQQNLLKSMGNEKLEAISIKNILEDIDFVHSENTAINLFETAKNKLPELKLAEQALKTQELKIAYERKQNRPDLELNGNYSWVDSPIQKSDLYGYIGLSLNYTLFNGFQKRNKVAKEEIILNQYEYQKDNLVHLIYREIEQALLVLKEAIQEIENSRIQMKNSAKNLETVREEYKSGISSMLELLDAENDDFRARQNYVNALFGYQSAKATIERKSGRYNY